MNNGDEKWGKKERMRIDKDEGEKLKTEKRRKIG